MGYARGLPAERGKRDFEAVKDLKQYIRDVPDFPMPGVLFKDITPLLSNPTAFCQVIDHLTQKYEQSSLDSIVAIDARGFLFAAPVAYRLGKPLIPAASRASSLGRLARSSIPWSMGKRLSRCTSMVWGKVIKYCCWMTCWPPAALWRRNQISGEHRGEVAGVAVVIELTELDGRKGLEGYDVYSIVQY